MTAWRWWVINYRLWRLSRQRPRNGIEHRRRRTQRRALLDELYAPDIPAARALTTRGSRDKVSACTD